MKAQRSEPKPADSAIKLATAAESASPFDIEDKIDRKAWKRSRGDVALFLHHRALLAGEWAIYCQGKQWQFQYSWAQHLDQYQAAEKSVIEGWRKYVSSTMRIPRDKQGDIYEGDCAVVLDALRRKPRSGHGEVITRKASTFADAAKRGDANFIRAVGRLASQDGTGKYLEEYRYAQALLSRWLVGYLWLMPVKLASETLSNALKVPESLKGFLSARRRYGLKSHNPSLIHGVERVPGNADIQKLLLTDGLGKRLFRQEVDRRSR